MPVLMGPMNIATPERRVLRRPQFSWTRIKGESDVEGGGGMVRLVLSIAEFG